MKKRTYTRALLPFTLLAILTGCSQEAEVSFSNDISPILNKSCMKCHVGDGKGITKSGLDMSTYYSLMKGTNFGPVITPGSSVSSTLVRMIQGITDPSLNMPHGKDQKPLSPAEIDLFKKWIDQGAKNN